VLELSFSFTKLLLYSVALRPQVAEQPRAAEAERIDAFFSTLEAGKRFLDTILSFPAAEYHLISFSEWMRLPTVIMTVAKLCMPNDTYVATGWDVVAAQDKVRLDLCLESLCYRMQSLSTYDKTKQPHPDFWHAMCFINDLTKTWFVRKIRPDQPTQRPSEPTPGSSVGQSTSDLSGPSSGIPAMRSVVAAGQPHNTIAGINYMGDINMEMGMEEGDTSGPFAFMKDHLADIDMEQFFEMGIWGDESYNSFGGMDFGPGAPSKSLLD
jgi:hypothetical protein